MKPLLIIGIGNRYRGDDGVARHVIDRLRARCGRRPLTEARTQALVRGVDTLFVRQLVPELAPVACAYARLVFVDAHVRAEPRAVVRAELAPGPRPAILSHVLPPEAFLWLVAAVCGRAPAARAVSVRGHCFEPGRRLSAATAALVDAAADAAWRPARTAAPAAPRQKQPPNGGTR